MFKTRIYPSICLLALRTLIRWRILALIRKPRPSESKPSACSPYSYISAVAPILYLALVRFGSKGLEKKKYCKYSYEWNSYWKSTVVYLNERIPKMWFPSMTRLIMAIMWGCEMVMGRVCPGTQISPSWTTTGNSWMLSSSRSVLPLTSSIAPRYWEIKVKMSWFENLRRLAQEELLLYDRQSSFLDHPALVFWYLQPPGHLLPLQ